MAFAAIILATGSLNAQSYGTFFIANQNDSLDADGDWWYQRFVLSGRGQTTFVSRFASRYSADCAILTGDQLSNFVNGRGYRGYAIFDNRFGSTGVTLGAGTYYLAVRNESSSDNVFSVELDYWRAPSGQRITAANFMSATRAVSQNGGRLWHSFTWNRNRGRSLYIDGCNSGNLQCYLISASEFSNWRDGRTFRYFYSWSGGYAPGLEWLNLPAGQFYFVAYNGGSQPESLTYNAWVTGR